MQMLQNRTTISQATVFAAAMASVCLPFASTAAYAGTSQFIRLNEFRALKESAGWSVLRSKLHSWRDLPDDWDGDDGIAPSADTIRFGKNILAELEDYDSPCPMVSIAGDGEIAFEWTSGDGFASISVTHDGQLLAYLREDGVEEALRIDAPFTDDALSPFLERIGAFV